MSDSTNDNTDESPYRLQGHPPLPFSEEPENERGVPVYGVLELGRPNEQPTIDRVFLDDEAAHHHANRIQNTVGIPAIVIQARLE